MISKIEPLEQVLSGEDTFDLAIGWMQNNQVAEVHLSEEIEALLEVIGCDDSVGIFDHVWPEINERIFFHFVFLGILRRECKIDGAAIKTTTEHLPWQNFFLSSLRELFHVKMALIIDASR